MWARRIGIPALWPSRIKVILFSVIHLSILLQARQYLQAADISYLNLRLPADERVTCRRPPRGVCGRADSPLECLLRNKTHGFGLQIADFLPEECPWQGAPLCSGVAVPARVFGDAKLGKLYAVGKVLNPLEGWSTWLLVLMLCLCGSILLHDLALLQVACRPRIYSLLAMRLELPRLWKLQRSLRCAGQMHRLYNEDRRRWMYLLVPWAAWQVIVYVLFLYPLLLLVSLVYVLYDPVRMSRVAVFMSGIFCTLWALAFLLVASYESLVGRSYAVLWDRTIPFHHRMLETPEVLDCVCSCEHPLNKHTTLRLLTMGVLMIICTSMVTFQALKGLRHARWANLFSVTYSVPIEVFPVEWCQPDGGPIQNRTADMPVQGEPAFDPFCLMDEQPESWRSKLRLAPMVESEAKVRETPWGGKQREEDREPRFCGFPRFSARESSEEPTVASDEDLSLDWEPTPDEACRSHLLPPL